MSLDGGARPDIRFTGQGPGPQRARTGRGGPPPSGPVTRHPRRAGSGSAPARPAEGQVGGARTRARLLECWFFFSTEIFGCRVRGCFGIGGGSRIPPALGRRWPWASQGRLPAQVMPTRFDGGWGAPPGASVLEGLKQRHTCTAVAPTSGRCSGPASRYPPSELAASLGTPRRRPPPATLSSSIDPRNGEAGSPGRRHGQLLGIRGATKA